MSDNLNERIEQARQAAARVEETERLRAIAAQLPQLEQAKRRAEMQAQATAQYDETLNDATQFFDDLKPEMEAERAEIRKLIDALTLHIAKVAAYNATVREFVYSVYDACRRKAAYQPRGPEANPLDEIGFSEALESINALDPALNLYPDDLPLDALERRILNAYNVRLVSIYGLSRSMHS